MIEKEMDTPMPETSSKLADLDYTSFLKAKNENLSCPECEIIPAIFIEKGSKNLFSISSGCENQHSIHNMNIREYFQKSNKKNDYNEKEIITLCQEHKENYQFFCKNCHKNICNKCLSESHQNHNMIKFQDIKPSNEEISNLKNSIKNEIKITSEFFTLEFYRWIEELKDKFEDLMDIISNKNKLYNKIISNYESGNLNYQIIHNIKVVIKDQMTRNPISKELAKLLTIITSANKEKKEGLFNPEKNQQFLHILDIENCSLESNTNPPVNKTNINNNNAQTQNNKSNEKFLEDFINNPSRKIANQPLVNNAQNENIQKMNQNQDQAKMNNNNNFLNKTMTFNQRSKANLGNLNVQNYNNINIQKKVKSFYSINNKGNPPSEFQLTGKKLKQNIDIQEFIHSITLLKSHNSQKFAAGLETGLVKIYSIDDKSGEISSYLDIKEHGLALTYVLGLNNGNLLTCSVDKFLKIIKIPKGFFKTYYVAQTIKCAPDSFHFQTAIEMTDNNLIAGDWKNIVIYKPVKKGGSNEDFEYEELNKIVINNRITALLQVDDGIFVSAHYGIAIINFFDTIRKNTTTLKNIKCSDESPNCMCIISTNSNRNEGEQNNNDKVLVIGGIQCMYFISIKYRVLIYKLFLPDATYFSSIVNSGYQFYSNNILCCGLFNNYSNDIVLYSVLSQGGHNKFNLVETLRISEADKSAINSILLYKKKNPNNPSVFVMITGGNEKKLKTYV